MNERTLVDLTELAPAGMAAEHAGRQERKSSDTRLTILNAAIHCIAEVGYARATNRMIAKSANVSRGAMLHHYATRQELTEAVIDYAFYCHMEEFGQAITALSDEERRGSNSIELDWQLFRSRPNDAYLELTIASRTDPELRAMFVPRARRHDQIWCDQLVAIFPEWRHNPELLNHSRRLVTAMLGGMILNHDVWNDTVMEETLLRFMSDVLTKLREGELRFPSA